MTQPDDTVHPDGVENAAEDREAEALAEELAGAEASRERTETEQRYARPGADHLSDEMVAEIRRRTTGAEAAAFFDLDKTVIARSSTLVMGRTLMRDGLISTSMLLRGLYAQMVYQLVGADHERMEQMRHALLDLSKGWEAERVRRLVRETLEQILVPLVYAEALELIGEHRASGRDVWIVSSSGEEVVEPLAEHLGIRDVIATRSGLDEHGRYDGTLEFYAYAGNKATAVRQVAEVRGYDLARSYVYSDSITDLPFLNAVGNPVAVNPDRELRAAALAMGWEVRDFRSPVSLRSRLPDVQRPSNGILWAALGTVGAGYLLWRWLTEDDA